MYYQVVLVQFLVYLSSWCQAADKFNEELFVKPFQSGHVNSYFQFTTEWLLQNNESRKCRIHSIERQL